MRWDPATLVINPVFPGLKELLLLLLCCCFIAFAQEVLNAKIFLLGELQLVAKDQEDAFTLHVSDFSEYSHCPQQDCFLYHPNIQFITKCVHPSTEALANAPQSSYNHWYNLNLFQSPKPFWLSPQILIFFNVFNFFPMYPTITWYSNIHDDAWFHLFAHLLLLLLLSL